MPETIGSHREVAAETFYGGHGVSDDPASIGDGEVVGHDGSLARSTGSTGVFKVLEIKIKQILI